MCGSGVVPSKVFWSLPHYIKFVRKCGVNTENKKWNFEHEYVYVFQIHNHLIKHCSPGIYDLNALQGIRVR